MSDFADRLLKARSRAGFTQRELSLETGISTVQLSRYEAGKSTPRPPLMSKLAEALDVTDNWLANGVEIADDPYPIEITPPPELLVKLEAEAKINNRPLNAEIMARLEESFQRSISSAPAISDCIEQLKIKYSRLGVLIAELTSIRQYRMQLRMDVRLDGLVVSDEIFDGLDDDEEKFSTESEMLRKEIEDLERLIATKGDERFNLAA